jgi:cytochrome c-type protein NapB
MDRGISSLNEENLVPPGFRQFIPILGAIIAGLAVVGFVVGIRELPPVDRELREPETSQANYPTAVTYGELISAPLWNDPLAHQTIKDLKFSQPSLFDPVRKTDDMILAAIGDRARRRAYDGAPPTVPHPIDQFSAAACVACHRDGIKVGDRVASKMSHGFLSNCTQCHVSELSYVASPGGVELASSFVGVERAGRGERASPGAPPIIPHHVWMRENCLSCHGTLTREGIRSTHPWLSNCQQCHAAHADREPSMAMGAER